MMAKVLENLSEDEAYLWGILSDPTGVDLCEFSFVDEEQKDSCFRLWPYQWRWFQCTDALQIDQSGRSVGKSLSIKIRMFSFPFLHPGQEAVITGPELVHVKPLIRQIQNQFLSTRLGRYMLPSGRNHGIVSWPFELKCRNGATIYGRIPQKDGKAIKGTHPLHLEMDESQDYPEPGWTELIETLKRGHAGASWRAHGVTRGVRDHFYKFTQPDSGWTVHRITAMHRPTWSDQERREKVDMYGSKDHPDYRRNILGLHGDSQSPLFALFRLMACVDNDEMSDYNTDVYRHYRINGETLSETNMPITSFLDFPQAHKKEYDKFWAGMDVGYTNHPSEILVFGEKKHKEKGSILTLLSRIHLERVAIDDQADAIIHVTQWYGTKAFSMDKTGNGLPLFQSVQARVPKIAPLIKGYNFAGKILAEFDTTVEIDEHRDDPIEKAGIEKFVLEVASDELRGLVDAGRMWLPWDRELIGEFQGQTFVVVKDHVNIYGRKIFNRGSFHTLDAAKMAVLGWRQEHMEALVAMHSKHQETITPIFIGF